MARRWPDDLQLHANQPILDLPAALSPSLSRWLEGKRHTGRDALRAGIRTGTRCLFPARRCSRCFVSRMERMSKPGLALFERTILGIACCSRASCFWTASARTTAFAFASRAATCRSSSRGQFRARTISSPMLMPSESWTERAACSNGKPPPAATRKNPQGLLALDPQLVCYSWMTGISEVAQVVFVRKRLVEIQYLRHHDHERAAAGVRPVGRRHHPANRVRTVSAAQRHSLSAEPLQHLPVPGTLPGKARVGRCRAGAAARSREPWLA